MEITKTATKITLTKEEVEKALEYWLKEVHSTSVNIEEIEPVFKTKVMQKGFFVTSENLLNGLIITCTEE